MITADYIRTRFPEFVKVDDDRMQAFIDVAALSINVGVWKTKADYATALLVAHTLKVFGIGSKGPSGAGGPVTMERIGDIARGYGTFDSKEGFGGYRTTPYGVEFINLRKTVVRGPLVT